MKLLLDTHVFLWLRNEPEKIPQPIMNLYEDIRSDVFFKYGQYLGNADKKPIR